MIINIFEDIAEWTIAGVQGALNNITPGETIELNIASYGGELLSAIAVIDLLKATGCRTVCTIVGFAASAAGIIALSCDEVNISPLGSIMLHSAWSPDGVEDEGIKRCNDLQLQIIQKRNPSIGDELFKQDNWYNAQQALELGLVDRIISKDSNFEAACIKYAAYLKKEVASMDQETVEQIVEQVVEEVEEKKEEVEENVQAEEEPSQPAKPSLTYVVEQLVARIKDLEERIMKLENPGESVSAECEPDSDEDKEQARISNMIKSLVRPKAVVPVAIQAEQVSKSVHKVDYKKFANFIDC